MVVDPYLFEMMHGLHKPIAGKAQTPREPKNPYESLMEKAIKDEADRQLADDYSHNQLVSQSERRASLERQLKQSFDLSILGENIKRSHDILVNEASRYLDREQQSALSEFIAEIGEGVADIDLDDELNLSESIAISPEMAAIITNIGIQKFDEGLVEDSLAIFALLTTIDSENPNHWYRLGIASQKIPNLELALRAYAAAAYLSPEDVGPHVLAAECYADQGKVKEASAELEEIKKIVQTAENQGEWSEQIANIEAIVAAISLEK